MRGVALACVVALSSSGCSRRGEAPPGEKPAARPPPEGTVSREQGEGLGWVTWQEVRPRLDESFVRRGAQRYAESCASCHGPLADGKEGVPSLVALPDKLPGQLFQSMAAGPSHAPAKVGVFSPKSRWEVTAWLRAVQLASVPLQALSSEEQRELLLSPKTDGGAARFEWADREAGLVHRPFPDGLRRLLAGDERR